VASGGAKPRELEPVKGIGAWGTQPYAAGITSNYKLVNRGLCSCRRLPVPLLLMKMELLWLNSA